MVNALCPLVVAASLGAGIYVFPVGGEAVVPLPAVKTVMASEIPTILDGSAVAEIVPLAVIPPSDFDPAHIEWCQQRYRSYNPRDNSWVSYSGRVRECKSPFW